MRVLPAVLADPGRIGLDVTGIRHRPVEWRGQQQDQAVVATHEICDPAPPSRAPLAPGPRHPRARSTSARSNRCGIRSLRPIRAACRRRSSRVDTSRHPSRAARARRASPAACERQLAARRLLAARLGQRRKRRQRQVQEPPEPGALATPALAHAVHAVVPVARADQWQPVRADGETPLERARAVLEEGCRLVGRHGLEVVARTSPSRSAGPSRNGTISSRTAASPVAST